MRIRCITWLGVIVLFLLGMGVGCTDQNKSNKLNLATLKKHDGSVSVCFSPDGMYLASGGSDRTIKIWQVGDWRELATLKGHRNGVYKVAFSPDGKYLVSGSDTIKIWQVGDWRELATLKEFNFGIGTAVTFSPDGKYLASSGDKTIKIWRVGDWRELATIKEHKSRITAVTFSPDGKYLASGSDDKTVRIWRVGDWDELKKFITNCAVKSVVFSYNGKYLVSGCAGTIKTWWKGNWEEPINTTGSVNIEKVGANSIAISSDGKYMASGAGVGGIIKLLNMNIIIKSFLSIDAEIEKRELPAELVVSNPQFQDHDSFCYHDKILNAGEKANIEFILKDKGKGIGFDVVFDIKSDNVDIDTLSFQRKIGDICKRRLKMVPV